MNYGLFGRIINANVGINLTITKVNIIKIMPSCLQIVIDSIDNLATILLTVVVEN